MADNSNPRVALIEQRLQAALHPTKITIIDDSPKHAGHAGAKASGGGYFTIEVIAADFANKSAVARHRMIYTALGDAMQTEIHALSIKAQTPEEAATQLQ